MGASNGKAKSLTSFPTVSKSLGNDNYPKNKSSLLSKFQEKIKIPIETSSSPSSTNSITESDIKLLNSESLEFIENIKKEFISHIQYEKTLLFETVKSSQEELTSLHEKLKKKQSKLPSEQEIQKSNNALLEEVKTEINKKESENTKIIKKNPKQGKIYKSKIIKLFQEIDKDNSNIIKKNSKFFYDIEKNYEKNYYLLSNDIYYCEKKKKENCPLNYLINTGLTKLEENFSNKVEKIKKETNTKNLKLEQKIKGEVNDVIEVYMKKCKEEKNEMVTKILNLIEENEKEVENKKNCYNEKISNKLEEIKKNYNNYENEVNNLILNDKKKEIIDNRKNEYLKKYENIENDLIDVNKNRVEKIKEQVTKEILEIREKNKERILDKNKIENIGFGEVKLVDENVLKELNEKCEICPIDNEAYELGQYLIICPCGHMYHIACIAEWAKEHDTCPMCRKSFK